jgi:hypothetical protein
LLLLMLGGEAAQQSGALIDRLGDPGPPRLERKRARIAEPFEGE